MFLLQKASLEFDDIVLPPFQIEELQLKDNIYLLITAILVSLASWAFFHYLGQTGYAIFNIVVMISLITDNIRLRHLLRSRNPG